MAEQVGDELSDNVVGPFFAVLLVTFTAGSVLEGRRLWLAGGIAIALAELSTAIDEFPDDVSSYLFTIALGVVAPMLFGQLMRNRTRLNRALREKAARLERERARRPTRRCSRSARGSPASCTTSSRTRSRR